MFLFRIVNIHGKTQGVYPLPACCLKASQGNSAIIKRQSGTAVPWCLGRNLSTGKKIYPP
jgi:hypothetical protein